MYKLNSALITDAPIIINRDMIKILDSKRILTKTFIKKLADSEINDFVEIPIIVYPFVEEAFKKKNYVLQVIDKNDFVVICTKEKI